MTGGVVKAGAGGSTIVGSYRLMITFALFWSLAFVGILVYMLSPEDIAANLDIARQVQMQPVKTATFGDMKKVIIAASPFEDTYRAPYFGELALAQAVSVAARDSAYVLVYGDSHDAGYLAYMLATHLTYDHRAAAHVIALHLDHTSLIQHSAQLQKLRGVSTAQQRLLLGGVYG